MYIEIEKFAYVIHNADVIFSDYFRSLERTIVIIGEKFQVLVRKFGKTRRIFDSTCSSRSERQYIPSKYISIWLSVISFTNDWILDVNRELKLNLDVCEVSKNFWFQNFQDNERDMTLMLSMRERSKGFHRLSVALSVCSNDFSLRTCTIQQFFLISIASHYHGKYKFYCKNPLSHSLGSGVPLQISASTTNLNCCEINCYTFAKLRKECLFSFNCSTQLFSAF